MHTKLREAERKRTRALKELADALATLSPDSASPANSANEEDDFQASGELPRLSGRKEEDVQASASSRELLRSAKSVSDRKEEEDIQAPAPSSSSSSALPRSAKLMSGQIPPPPPATSATENLLSSALAELDVLSPEENPKK
ncbi:uncharacterized protein MYCFIDRAFT_200817 [Pseudocercospora fijiensis CIRAD86]|uniref:Uncharacterized protein n=1 Tax=Pseudocercospora fijiensis (strain CIRAD86) TaxID=383855 RepID=M2YGU8_PSEFD|nr:uncharacterized protein MYCFIDRAFT_200817 [Pseudocercospora fijiensis CIRAD86]EME77040.1 hypothetical protein MYCFIDRAFT_200817 [Pseudocercospora fijiensis CIRAD86]